MDQMEWLEKWFQETCNEYWEHFYGIEIGTLDNPGWYIKIDLKETQYENMKMEEIKREQGDNDWMRCMISDGIFSGVGDCLKLGEIIQVFKNVIERETEMV
ncbi:MAG: rhodanese-related sulfurtransferase [Lachnospiraceae bacterium]|nr:rhodanese-related sulfurtransferase [Lachnospiraceae bacterium]